MERVPLLFLPTCSSRRNIRLRDKLRELILLFFFYPFPSQRFALIVVEAYSPSLTSKGWNSKAAGKGKRISPPRFNRDTNDAARSFFEKRAFGRRVRFQRTFDPLFFAGTTNNTEYHNISGGAGKAWHGRGRAALDGLA